MSNKDSIVELKKRIKTLEFELASAKSAMREDTKTIELLKKIALKELTTKTRYVAT